MRPRPPHGLPGVAQTTRETPQPALTTKPQQRQPQQGPPDHSKPLSRSTLGPHLARGSGLEWGLPAVIPGRALPALLFKSAGERKNSNNKKGAAERRGPAVTNAVTQGPLPPQVLIILAPPAEPPHRSRAGDTTAPRPAVLGVSSPNPPGAPQPRLADRAGHSRPELWPFSAPARGHGGSVSPAGWFGVSVARRAWLCGQPWLSAWRHRCSGVPGWAGFTTPAGDTGRASVGGEKGGCPRGMCRRQQEPGRGRGGSSCGPAVWGDSPLPGPPGPPGWQNPDVPRINPSNPPPRLWGLWEALFTQGPPLSILGSSTPENPRGPPFSPRGTTPRAHGAWQSSAGAPNPRSPDESRVPPAAGGGGGSLPLQADTCPPSPCQDPGGSGPSREPPAPGTEGLWGTTLSPLTPPPSPSSVSLPNPHSPSITPPCS